MAEELTISDYAFWPTPEQAEYGLLLCVDGDGIHWTLRGEKALVQSARDAKVTDFANSSLADTDWERREGWPDEWVEERFVTNASGQLITMRDDGLIMGTAPSAEEVEPGWHPMTESEYTLTVEFIGESELRPELRRAEA